MCRSHRDCPAWLTWGLHLGQPEGYGAGQDLPAGTRGGIHPAAPSLCRRRLVLGLVSFPSPVLECPGQPFHICLPFSTWLQTAAVFLALSGPGPVSQVPRGATVVRVCVRASTLVILFSGSYDVSGVFPFDLHCSPGVHDPMYHFAARKTEAQLQRVSRAGLIHPLASCLLMPRVSFLKASSSRLLLCGSCCLLLRCPALYRACGGRIARERQGEDLGQASGPRPSAVPPRGLAIPHGAQPW